MTDEPRDPATEVLTHLPDMRYHSPGCTDRITSHTWMVSGKACGTAAEISDAPEYLREHWRRDRLAELAASGATAGDSVILRGVVTEIRDGEALVKVEHVTDTWKGSVWLPVGKLERS